MSCVNHRTNTRGCKLCLARITQRFEDQFLLLGPRTKLQFEELFARCTQSAEWATSPDLPEFSNLALRDKDMYIHRFHAEASRVAESATFVPLSPAFALSRTALKSDFVANNINTTRIKGVLCGRQKTKHCVYDVRSMLSAIELAGSKGIARTDLVAEYESAYIDLQGVIEKEKVFATPTRVWSRTVAPLPSKSKSEKFRNEFRTLMHGI